jgi:hypothetical protein
MAGDRPVGVIVGDHESHYFDFGRMLEPGTLRVQPRLLIVVIGHFRSVGAFVRFHGCQRRGIAGRIGVALGCPHGRDVADHVGIL